jgi:cell division initiation protein
LGGYSRAETNRLLDRAARTLEQNSSSKQTEISTVEQAVGEVLVTAHHAAEVVRNEAKQEADGLLEAARSEARELVADAKRQTEELEAAKARVENALVRAQEEARASREAAEREIVELHAEARRLRSVVDEFRDQWRTLISDALRQLELRFPSADAPADTAEGLQDDLRSRLIAPREEKALQQEANVESPVVPARSSPGDGTS